MSSKTPVRVVFDGSNNATGLAEFQSGEFIPLSAGGIGALVGPVTQYLQDGSANLDHYKLCAKTANLLLCMTIRPNSY